jgi:hypothetical protein
MRYESMKNSEEMACKSRERRPVTIFRLEREMLQARIWEDYAWQE